MTLSFLELKKRVVKHFPDAVQIDDSIVHYTRRLGGQPFAVYYLDLARELPSSEESLTKYQDRVIGRRYFEGSKKLQWSNYLYFILSKDRIASSDVRKAKELIEGDRNYARKFVISEADLDSVLEPHVVAPEKTRPGPSILTVWTDLLLAAGLDRAILCDKSLPARLRIIESSHVESAAPPSEPVRKAACEPVPSIDALTLREFRKFPLQRSFRFGTVNLIFGPNGSGKTSLLEAIELFYCGRSKRNPDAKDSYNLVAELSNGRTESATNKRSPQSFRKRNLDWYAQREVKTNNLCWSFAQFNFLDTDAAVSLANSSSEIEKNLSILLVGPEASKVWRDIERVQEALKEKLRELRPTEQDIQDELNALKKRLKEAQSVRRESHSIRLRLEKMLRRIQWQFPLGATEESASGLVESLSELIAVLLQASKFDWTESPVSIAGLASFCRDADTRSEQAGKYISQLAAVQKNQHQLVDTVRRTQEASDLASQAQNIIDSEIPKRTGEFRKLERTVAKYSNWLAGLDRLDLGILLSDEQDITLDAKLETIVSDCSLLESALKRTQEEYSNFTKLRDHSLNLAQELREVAQRVLRESPTPDRCPLCHTEFRPGELEKHINRDVENKQLELRAQRLLSLLQAQQKRLQEASALESVLRWVQGFCQRANVGPEIIVRSAIAEVEAARQRLDKAQKRLPELRSEIEALESQGLSIGGLEEVLDRLRELDFPLAEPSRKALDQLVLEIAGVASSSSQALEEERKKASRLQEVIGTTLGSARTRVRDLRSEVFLLKERIVETETLSAKLSKLIADFPWPEEKPLAELLVEARSIRKVAAELQRALSAERKAEVVFLESTSRTADLEKKLEKLRPRIQRLSEAEKALTTLRKKNSLTEAMAEALERNRESIEAVFSQIHHPLEFRGLGSQLTTLTRKEGNAEAKLSEISTGQRAAFALSIFLAQNAQLTEIAPPVVLIDDPIAHVDDLNCLSFLDYVRELSLTKQRQIFFATANSKLAALFERKFDFLGPGFRRINLKVRA